MDLKIELIKLKCESKEINKRKHREINIWKIHNKEWGIWKKKTRKFKEYIRISRTDFFFKWVESINESHCSSDSENLKNINTINKNKSMSVS